MKLKKIALFASVTLLCISSLAATDYCYRELTGANQSEGIVSIDEDASTGLSKIRYDNSIKKESHVFIIDSSGATIAWTYTYPDGKIQSFTREGNVILIGDGTDTGKTKIQVSIDESPWFASIDWSLAEFSRQGKQEILFWTVNPENGKPFKMQAKRMNDESVVCNGKSIPAVHIQITAKGVSALFFNMNCWYRKADGLFIRYEGMQGGLLSPKIITELVSEG